MDRAITDSPPRGRRLRRLTLRSAVLLIAILAFGFGAYRHYERHVRQGAVAYSVADLIRADAGSGDPGGFAPLIASIRSEVAPGSWQGRGGSGTIAEFYLNDSLIVRNSVAAHEQLAAFLRQQRSAREAASAPGLAQQRRPSQGAAP